MKEMRNAVFSANEQVTDVVVGFNGRPGEIPPSENRAPGSWCLVPRSRSDAMRESLRVQLESHRAADASEARSQFQILEFLNLASEPFSRATLPGHITGSAIVVHPDGQEVLLVKHRKLNRWLQPGGHVHEHDESVLVTAVRETAEETGHVACVALLHDRILHVDVHEIPARPEEAAHMHYDIRYLLSAKRDTPRITEDEVVEAEWFKEAELERLNLDASLQSAIASARRHRR